MTFLSVVARQVEKRDILLIGDCPSAESLKEYKQLDVRWESVLEQALHMAGLTKSDVNYINLFPDSINTFAFWQDSNKASKRMFKPAAQPWLEKLHEAIDRYDPKVIIPLGQIPLKAILNRTDYTKIRGYPFPRKDGSTQLVIPSLHPKEMIWSNYVWRFYLSNDLRRAKDFADGILKIIEPKLIIPQTFTEASAYLYNLWKLKTPTAFDIEVSNHEVSCIGFSNIADFAFTIPFDDRWTELEEVKLWHGVAQILENPEIIKITQNGSFDTYFLAYKNGIITRGVLEDTMIGSSITYPDFLKGLGFLGSIHTTYTYWKDQANFKSIKAED